MTRTDARTVAPVAPATGLPRFAAVPVLVVAGLVAVVLFATSGRYGYFGDELYFLAAGHHPMWGYADQPAGLPMLARGMDLLFPGWLPGLRLPATLATAAGVVLTALTAREFGGARRAQLLAALAWAGSWVMLGGGHLLATSTLDPVAWTGITLLLVRWVRLHHAGVRRDRLLLAAGLVTAVDLQVKYLIPAFWVVAGLAALAVGPRALLRRPALWVGAAVAVGCTVPALVWQARHGWPQVGMGHAISAASGVVFRVAFVPLAVLLAGLLVSAVLLLYGAARLLRSPDLRPYRFLGVTVVGVTAVFVASGGQAYYLAGLYALCWAAGAAELQRHRPAAWWRWVPTPPVAAACALLAVFTLPVLPVSRLARAGGTTVFNVTQVDQVGWPQLADQVRRDYRALPADTRRHAVLMTGSYGAAAALARFGPERGLPPVYSANTGYWYLARPPERSGAVLFAGDDPGWLHRVFGSVRRLDRVDNGLGVRNSMQGRPIWLCTGRRASWSATWPTLREV